MYRRGKHVAWQTVAGEAVLIDLSVGNTLGLNGTGAIVWQGLETESPEELATHVAASYSVDVATARADVEAFLATLLERGLITDKES